MNLHWLNMVLPTHTLRALSGKVGSEEEQQCHALSVSQSASPAFSPPAKQHVQAWL